MPMKAGGFPAAAVTDVYEPLSLALVLRSEFGWPGRARASHCWVAFPVAIGVPFPLSKLSCVAEKPACYSSGAMLLSSLGNEVPKDTSS